MALSYVRCPFLRSTFAATAPRSAVAELGVVRRLSTSPAKPKTSNMKHFSIYLATFAALTASALAEPATSAPRSFPILPLIVIGAIILIVYSVRRENRKAPSQITTRPSPGMNRPASYLLIVIGAPLGYVASYFGQPGFIRMFMSLGDYIGSVTNILNDPPGASRLPASVCQTAWNGVILGMALMAIFAMIMSSRNRA